MSLTPPMIFKVEWGTLPTSWDSRFSFSYRLQSL